MSTITGLALTYARNILDVNLAYTFTEAGQARMNLAYLSLLAFNELVYHLRKIGDRSRYVR